MRNNSDVMLEDINQDSLQITDAELCKNLAAMFDLKYEACQEKNPRENLIKEHKVGAWTFFGASFLALVVGGIAIGVGGEIAIFIACTTALASTACFLLGRNELQIVNQPESFYEKEAYKEVMREFNAYNSQDISAIKSLIAVGKQDEIGEGDIADIDASLIAFCKRIVRRQLIADVEVVTTPMVDIECGEEAQQEQGINENGETVVSQREQSINDDRDIVEAALLPCLHASQNLEITGRSYFG